MPTITVLLAILRFLMFPALWLGFKGLLAMLPGVATYGVLVGLCWMCGVLGAGFGGWRLGGFG